MKKIVATLAIMMITVVSSFAIVVDLKVPNNDKARLSGFEIGAMYYMNDKGVKVFDVGEDYAVWLTLLTEESVGSNQRLTIKIEITKASLAFKSKQILANRTITIEVPRVSGESMNTADNSFLQFAKEKAVDIKDQKFLDGKIGGKILADNIIQMLTGLIR